MKNHPKKTKKNGGHVIASGGFGCIFNPPLTCKKKQKTMKRKKNIITNEVVSKLMFKEYAKKEYNDVIQYKKQLDTIPNYTNYFLIDGFSLCQDPHLLTVEDLHNFNKKCKALKKKNITQNNVNKSLDKLAFIQMPYGGIAVDDYIQNVHMNQVNTRELNKLLINLLENGIVPMNQRGVYHCDIKDSNVLVYSDTTRVLYTRIIDWGLSCIYPSTEKKILSKGPIPEELTHRPFQFNIPFSIILFQSSFLKLYQSFLNKNTNYDYFKIRSFVINYVLFLIDKKGPGHIKNINSTIKHFFKGELLNVEEKFKDDLIEFEYTFYFVFEYLSKILFHFTRENEFKVMDYFENVFLKNVDVWGFVTIYFSFVNYLLKVSNTRDLTKSEKKIIQTVKELYIILIENCCKPIDTNEIVYKLKSLDELFLHSTNIKGLPSQMLNETPLNTSSLDSTTIYSEKSTSKLKNSKQKTKKNFFTNIFS